MTAWRQVKLRDVATLNGRSRGRDWPIRHLRYVDISSVGEGSLNAEPALLDVADAPSRAKRLLEPGDTVLSTVRPGRRSMFFAQNPGSDWVVSTGFCTITADRSRADPRFLYFSVFSAKFTDYLLAHEKGSNYPAVTTDDIGNAPILLPPVPEQRAIAATLGALDDKIDSNHRSVALALDLLDALAAQQAAFQPRVPLGSIAQLVKTVARPAEYGSQVVAHYSLPAFDAGARPERVVASSVMSNKVALAGPAILVSRLNPRFNRTWWVSPAANEVSFASPEFAMLQAADRQALAAVWLAVRDATFRDEITKRVTGTSGSHQRIRPDDILATEVPDSRRMSDEVCDTTLTLLDRIESLRTEADALTSVREALLPELLSGRIRVRGEVAA